MNLPLPEQFPLLARLADRVTKDARVAAAWLEGSLGRGDFDPYSDIDLHLLLDREDDLRAIAENWTAFLAPVAPLAYERRVFGQLYHLIVEDGSRLDIALASGETHAVDLTQARILKGEGRLTPGTAPAFDPARAMAFDITEFWRVVLLLPVALGRGELLRAWQGGIGFQVSTLINLLARARGNPQAVGAKKLNVQMHGDDRARLESLLALPAFDAPGIARVTLGLAALMRESGPTCCNNLGQEYPHAWEAVVLNRLRHDLSGLGYGELLAETLGE